MLQGTSIDQTVIHKDERKPCSSRAWEVEWAAKHPIPIPQVPLWEGGSDWTSSRTHVSCPESCTRSPPLSLCVGNRWTRSRDRLSGCQEDFICMNFLPQFRSRSVGFCCAAQCPLSCQPDPFQGQWCQYEASLCSVEEISKPFHMSDWTQLSDDNEFCPWFR